MLFENCCTAEINQWYDSFFDEICRKGLQLWCLGGIILKAVHKNRKEELHEHSRNGINEHIEKIPL